MAFLVYHLATLTETEKISLDQGCQIFLVTKYQNGEKYNKLPRTIPNVHKILQKTIKWTKCP
jgi:hypothetical protein